MQVLRQTTLPSVPTRHQTFQRQLSHRLDFENVQFSVCRLEPRNEVGIIKGRQLLSSAQCQIVGVLWADLGNVVCFILELSKSLFVSGQTAAQLSLMSNCGIVVGRLGECCLLYGRQLPSSAQCRSVGVLWADLEIVFCIGRQMLNSDQCRSVGVLWADFEIVVFIVRDLSKSVYVRADSCPGQPNVEVWECCGRTWRMLFAL
ncbi:Synaptotagmin-9 [Homalodisca vitripennis]|nr:Synaptotagmin-9 [Homalodisca vitripennis]